MKKHSLVLACAAAFAVPAPAGAVTFFLGADTATAFPEERGLNSSAAEADFLAAAGPTTLVTFEGIPNGDIVALSPVAGLTLTGQNQFGNAQQVLDTPTCAINCGGNTTPGGAKFIDLNGGSLTATFANPISAFGVYVGGVQISTLTLSFNNGQQQSISLDPIDPDATFGIGALNFVGFTDSTNSILSVTLNTDGDIVSFDDLRFASASPTGAVPEPATWAMMIGGFGLVGGAMRVRRRRARVGIA